MFSKKRFTEQFNRRNWSQIHSLRNLSRGLRQKRYEEKTCISIRNSKVEPTVSLKSFIEIDIPKDLNFSFLKDKTDAFSQSLVRKPCANLTNLQRLLSSINKHIFNLL